MLGSVARILLVLTSLAPVAGAMAIVAYSDDKGPWIIACWLGVAVLLVVVCGLLLHFCRTSLERRTLTTVKVRSANKEVLAFLLAYLLPLLSKESLPIVGSPLVAIYVYGLIFLAVYHSETYHFNPLLSIAFAYHFYEIETSEGVTHVILSRRAPTKAKQTLTVVGLANHLYLDLEEDNA